MTFFLFLVIDLVFQIFCNKMSYRDPFYTGKTTLSEKNSLIRQFFTLFILSHTSDNTTSLNIGGTNAWAVPHLKFWGDRPLSPPRSPPLPRVTVRTLKPKTLKNHEKPKTFF